METICVQKILVPIDFSEASLNALNTAIFMAQRQHAQIILFHVVNTYSILPNPDHDIIYDSNLEKLLDEHLKNIRKLADKITNQYFVDCRAFIRTGLVSSEILRASIDFYADIIVLSTYSTSSTNNHFRIGSNTLSVIKNANCPVLTVPPEQKFEKFSTILYPIRPVKGALEQYDLAKTILRENKAELIVVGMVDNTHKESFELLNQETALLNQKLKEDNLKAQSYFYFSQDMPNKILEKAQDFQADLLVLTATLDHKVQDYYLGPFVERILHFAKIPVLSIRPKPSDTLEIAPVNHKNYATKMLGII